MLSKQQGMSSAKAICSSQEHWELRRLVKSIADLESISKICGILTLPKDMTDKQKH